jgi:hypothetical protein
MSLVLNGSGSITGLSAGGLPDGCITADDIGSLPAGSVLQVVQGTYATETVTSSATYVTTGLTASITPSSSSSKILVLASVQMATDAVSSADITRGWRTALHINGSQEFVKQTHRNLISSNSADATMSVTDSFNFLHSPATTSSTTYAIYMRTIANVAVRSCINNYPSHIILMEIAA